MLNLAVFLEQSALRFPEKEAVVCGEQRFTYSQINNRANQIAEYLIQSGMNAGDKVAMSCPNVPDFVMVYYGILKAGCVVVPLNILLTSEEIQYHLEDSQAKAYFCFPGTSDLNIAERGLEAFELVSGCEYFVMIGAANPGANSNSPITTEQLFDKELESLASIDVASLTQADDTAVILYTSGTTGKPKGAELSHSNLTLNAWQFADIAQTHSEERYLITLPLFHTFGQTAQMNTGIYAGATLVLMPKFEPEAALQLLDKEMINIFCGVPTMYWGLLNCQVDDQELINRINKHLRLCGSGGASLPVEIIKQFESKFQVPILEGYGLSETSPVVTFNRIEKARKPGSVGSSLWGIQVRVVNPEGEDVPTGETGEVVVKGHNVMKGYLNRPEATQQAIVDGWFHTGDVGKFDEDGDLFLIDRVKDMIIRGGYNVYPRELEETLLTHSAISFAAVVGIPDDRLGEEVKAFIILKDGAAASESEIVEWCQQHMAAYKYPRHVQICETLPMTATGKILKRELRQLITQEK